MYIYMCVYAYISLCLPHQRQKKKSIRPFFLELEGFRSSHVGVRNQINVLCKIKHS